MGFAFLFFNGGYQQFRQEFNTPAYTLAYAFFAPVGIKAFAHFH